MWRKDVKEFESEFEFSKEEEQLQVEFPALVKLGDNKTMEGSRVPKREKVGENKTGSEGDENMTLT